jgi:hypothetical protein
MPIANGMPIEDGKVSEENKTILVKGGSANLSQ